LTLTLGAIWGLLVLAMILSLPDVHPALALGSLIFPVYYFVLSAILQARRRATVSPQS
jgi:sorbitol-specific phosphotransferase system component IIBC